MKQFILISLFTIIGSVAFAQKGNKDVYYGNKSYREGDLKTAVKLYQKALDVEPENKAARINLAIAQSKLLATEASAENFDKALAGNKNNPALEAKLNYDKGTALAKGKKYEPAIDAFKKVLRSNPDDADARDNLQKAINELKKQQKKNKPKDQQKKQDKKNKQDKQDQQQKEQKKDQQQKMSKEQAEKMLQALRKQEKETQKKLQKKEGGIPPPTGEDW